MVETTKYILCGGEDLCRTYEGCGISEKAKTLFNKWAIASLADPCLHERESFLDMPVSSETRLLIKAIRERNKGSRTLTWYLGVELSKEDVMGASCYANLIRGILAISLKDVKNLIGGGIILSINLQHPSGLPQIQTPFIELQGKNFYGEYPRTLWEFCQKISINDIEDWFGQLFLAVNVEVADPAFTNIICEDPLEMNKSFSPIVDAQPGLDPVSTCSNASKNKRGAIMNKVLVSLLCVSAVFNVAFLYWAIDCSNKLSAKDAEHLKFVINSNQKDKARQNELEKMKRNYEISIKEKEKAIAALEKKINTMAAPKNIAKTLHELDYQINLIEARLNSLNNVSSKLNGLKHSLQELKRECSLPEQSKSGQKARSFDIFSK